MHFAEAGQAGRFLSAGLPGPFWPRCRDWWSDITKCHSRARGAAHGNNDGVAVPIGRAWARHGSCSLAAPDGGHQILGYYSCQSTAHHCDPAGVHNRGSAACSRKKTGSGERASQKQHPSIPTKTYSPLAQETWGLFEQYLQISL
ncbi:hypothetical protein SRHO_G00126590 [Serrasalmus rhombeus]